MVHHVEDRLREEKTKKTKIWQNSNKRIQENSSQMKDTGLWVEKGHSIYKKETNALHTHTQFNFKMISHPPSKYLALGIAFQPLTPLPMLQKLNPWLDQGRTPVPSIETTKLSSCPWHTWCLGHRRWQDGAGWDPYSRQELERDRATHSQLCWRQACYPVCEKRQQAHSVGPWGPPATRLTLGLLHLPGFFLLDLDNSENQSTSQPDSSSAAKNPNGILCLLCPPRLRFWKLDWDNQRMKKGQTTHTEKVR